MALTKDFKASLTSPTLAASGGISPSQPMDDAAFQQWLNPGSKPAQATPKVGDELKTPDQTGGGFSSTVNKVAGDTFAPVQEAGTKIAKTASDFANGPQTVGNAAQAGFDVAGEAAKGAVGMVTAPVNDAIKAVSDKASNNSTVQKIAGSKPVSSALDALNGASEEVKSMWATLEKNHPVLAKNIENSGNIAQFLGLAAGEKPVTDAATKAATMATDAATTAIDATKSAATKVVDTAKTAVTDAAEASKVQAAKQAAEQATAKAAETEKAAITDATPSYDKKLVEEGHFRDENGNLTPRIRESEGLPTNKRTVNSKPSEIASGKELARVEGYDPKSTNLNKANTVKTDLTKKAIATEKALESEKVLRPPKEIMKVVRTAVNEAADDSLLLQKTDPIVKNYMRVTQRAIEQADGTLAGEFKIRKALDAAYEKAGGKYADNKGLDEIHRAARNALTDDTELHAQNTDVKAALKQQTLLNRALEVLEDKAKAEGASGLDRFAKKHPIGASVAKKVGNLVGVGEVVNAVH